MQVIIYALLYANKNRIGFVSREFTLKYLHSLYIHNGQRMDFGRYIINVSHYQCKNISFFDLTFGTLYTINWTSIHYKWNGNHDMDNVTQSVSVPSLFRGLGTLLSVNLLNLKLVTFKTMSGSSLPQRVSEVRWARSNILLEFEIEPFTSEVQVPWKQQPISR